MDSHFNEGFNIHWALMRGKKGNFLLKIKMVFDNGAESFRQQVLFNECNQLKSVFEYDYAC